MQTHLRQNSQPDKHPFVKTVDKYRIKCVYKGDLHPGFIVHLQEGSSERLIGKLVPFPYGKIFTDRRIDEVNNNHKCHYLMYVMMSEDAFLFLLT
jgi:hypothetical protein